MPVDKGPQAEEGVSIPIAAPNPAHEQKGTYHGKREVPNCRTK